MTNAYYILESSSQLPYVYGPVAHDKIVNTKKRKTIATNYRELFVRENKPKVRNQ